MSEPDSYCEKCNTVQPYIGVLGGGPCPTPGCGGFCTPSSQNLRIIHALRARIAELEEDNAICREAIADCVDMLNDWEDTHYTDDHEDGCIRATERKLSEAIGKACPRLLYEPEEGRKYYGLRWKELVTERDAALARIAELERLHRQDQDAIEFNGEQGQHDQHLLTALRAKLQAAEAEAQRLREALERIADEDGCGGNCGQLHNIAREALNCERSEQVKP